MTDAVQPPWGMAGLAAHSDASYGRPQHEANARPVKDDLNRPIRLTGRARA